jgi:hypothetical protein
MGSTQIVYGILLHEHGDEIIRITASGSLDLRQYPWLHLRFHSLANPAMQALSLTVRVRMSQHTHRVGNAEVHLSPVEWGTQTSLSWRALHLARTAQEPGAIVRECIEKMLLEVSPRLYEHDPRIGAYPAPGQEQPIPRCPLFDPQRLFPPPDPSLMQEIALPIEPWDKGTPPPLWAYGRCRFCGEPFNPYNRPMWGGGNLLWVHQPCWVGAVGAA